MSGSFHSIVTLIGLLLGSLVACTQDSDSILGPLVTQESCGDPTVLKGIVQQLHIRPTSGTDAPLFVQSMSPRACKLAYQLSGGAIIEVAYRLEADGSLDASKVVTNLTPHK
jgi:hypothetical protein